MTMRITGEINAEQNHLRIRVTGTPHLSDGLCAWLLQKDRLPGLVIACPKFLPPTLTIHLHSAHLRSLLNVAMDNPDQILIEVNPIDSAPLSSSDTDQLVFLMQAGAGTLQPLNDHLHDVDLGEFCWSTDQEFRVVAGSIAYPATNRSPLALVTQSFRRVERLCKKICTSAFTSHPLQHA